MKTWSFFISLILMLVLGAALGYHMGGSKTIDTITVSDTIIKTDTIKVGVPYAVAEREVSKKTVTLPGKVILHTDTVIISDSVQVELPIAQKTYRDTAYTAWVSGYEAKLDSIHVYQRNSVVTNFQKANVKKWGVGVQVGVGTTGKRIEPYVGVGITYNFFSW